MARLVSLFLSLFIHVQGEHTFELHYDLRPGRSQVDGFNVLMALLTHVEPVDSLIICEVGQVFLILAPAIGTLQTLKKPFGITAGT